MNKEFLHCFRVQIVPGYYEEERLSSVVKFCTENNFKNVMLFINAEVYNTGHMTLSEAEPWVGAIKRAKKVLEENGISVSLNPWIEIGHLERGRALKEGQNFVTMVDYDGNTSKLVACPFDQGWRTYFKEFYQYLVKEVEPEVIWVEDDFRLHNHGSLKYGGCFCPLHMRAFNKRLGKNYTREEFTDKLFRKEADEDVKRAFLDVNRACMSDLAKFLGDTVREVSDKTAVGLMSSAHIRHEMEGRDWKAVHENLAAGGDMINRMHLPMYMESSIKGYYILFNAFTFILRGQLPREVKVYPELEISSFNTFSKDKECIRFQVESALPLELDGMTYDLFDYTGNGAVHAYGYGEAVNKITPYLNRVINSGYKFENLVGITFLTDERMCYTKKITTGDFMSLSPDIPYVYAKLQAYGISAKVSTDKEPLSQTVALYSDVVNSLSDEELSRLFKNNRAILDGSAVIALCERGLGHLAGIAGYDIDTSLVRSYEEIEGDRLISGVKGWRCTSHGRIGTYLNIKYIGEPNILSRTFDYMGNEVGIGNAISDGHFIFPYFSPSPGELCYDQFNPLHRELCIDYVLRQEREAVVSDYSGIYCYLSKTAENSGVLIMVNTTLSDFGVTRFHTSRKIEEITEICRDGVERTVSYRQADSLVTVDSAFAGNSTKTFVVVFKK